MNKKGKALVIFLLLLIGTGVFFLVQHISEKPGPVFEDTPVEPVPAPTPAAFESEKIKEKYYSLDLEYPKNSSTELPEIGVYIEKVRSDFLEFVPKTDEEAAYQGITEGRAYVLKTDTTVYTSSSTITYKLETYMFTGGAHGNTVVSTFTYTKDGKFIPLGNILSSPDSLTKLSSAARNYFYDKLEGQSERDEIDMGTTPQEDNFNAWYLTDNTITFVFQQYQIGPYVIGVQEFPISRAQARTMFSI